MPGAGQISGVAGFGPLDNQFTPDTNQRYSLGYVVEGFDPFFGYGEYLYGKSAAAMSTGRLVYPDFGHVMTDVPNTANTGMPVFVATQEFSAIDQFGWFKKTGFAAVQAQASVAAGVAVGVGAAGKAGTNTAGKQLLGMNVVKASTYAPTKVCEVQSAAGPTKRRINVPNVEGLFVGLAVSGVGVGAGVIASIDPSGLFITNSVDNTASAGGITVSFTWTGFLLVYLSSAFVQGAIT